MQPLDLADVHQYVEDNIKVFHEKRIQSIQSLKLKRIIARKNPYLFRAKHVLTAEQIVKGLVDAHISSNEETIFGDWLEGLAIFVNEKVYAGRKSGIAGIDLEFDKDHVRQLVAIKSGPNWGNSSQIKKMVSDFKTAFRTLRTSNSQISIIAVNGCCYGKDSKPDKGDYFKYCGQQFWHYISGNPELYKEIIEPLGFRSREIDEVFVESYAQMINRFTLEFAREFCLEDGRIDWLRLVSFNSGRPTNDD